jgi:hypothetical protein
MVMTTQLSTVFTCKPIEEGIRSVVVPVHKLFEGKWKQRYPSVRGDWEYEVVCEPEHIILNHSLASICLSVEVFDSGGCVYEDLLVLGSEQKYFLRFKGKRLLGVGEFQLPGLINKIRWERQLREVETESV